MRLDQLIKEKGRDYVRYGTFLVRVWGTYKIFKVYDLWDDKVTPSGNYINVGSYRDCPDGLTWEHANNIEVIETIREPI